MSDMDKERFLQIVEQVYNECGWSSNPRDYIEHPAYQEVLHVDIDTAPLMLSIVLEYLRDNPGAIWLWCLNTLATKCGFFDNKPIVNTSERVTTKGACDRWVSWGQQMGILK